MNKRDFLKASGLLGAASLLRAGNLTAGIRESADGNDTCVLIPQETAGPFPLDLTENTNFFRQDVREDRAGVQFNVRLKIIGNQNCFPMENVRVNIWHCDKDGNYSGYDNSMNPGQAGLTYLRGYQFTDVNGEVEFITIFPGWYQGRICHIHFQVYVSSQYSAISQLSFDIDTKNAIYAAHSDIYTKGADPMTFSQDNIFSDGYQYQLATLTPNSETGGYDTYLEVTVQGNGVLGTGHIEKQNAKQFSLGQNFPNPHKGATVIPYSIRNKSDVSIELFSLDGKKAHVVHLGSQAAGDYNYNVDLNSLGLPVSNYVYQIIVNNSDGIFRDCKMMSLSK
ncbi:MAG: hypothetical protein R2850_09345 [Bacteroidia bacterium]